MSVPDITVKRKPCGQSGMRKLQRLSRRKVEPDVVMGLKTFVHNLICSQQILPKLSTTCEWIAMNSCADSMNKTNRWKKIHFTGIFLTQHVNVLRWIGCNKYSCSPQDESQLFCAGTFVFLFCEIVFVLKTAGTFFTLLCVCWQLCTKAFERISSLQRCCFVNLQIVILISH